MVNSILDLVLNTLREAKFTATVAFPGQEAPSIQDTVAAVHIQEVDRARLSVTVGVHILCPGSMGGTACELRALEATRALRWSGARCIQKACRYDGLARVYGVEILAEYTGLSEDDVWRPGPGFRLLLEQTQLGFVESFRAVQKQDYAPEYAMGEESPVGYSRSREFWELRLEELLPAGSQEEAEVAAPFHLKILRGSKIEVYCNCRWTSVQREYTREGLRKIRTGISTERRAN